MNRLLPQRLAPETNSKKEDEMKKFGLLLLAILALGTIAAACDPNASIFGTSPTPAAKAPTAQALATNTPAPTATPTEAPKPTDVPPTATPVPTATSVPPTKVPAPTATPKPSWKLADPPDPSRLPNDLAALIKYKEPPVNCADKNDPQETCSTREGQATNGKFVLHADEAIVMTGDNIEIGQDGALADRPDLSINHDLWVLVNISKNDINLTMSAPHGSFRGYFSVNPGGTWTKSAVEHLRDLHLRRFLIGPQPIKVTLTPIANCGPNNINGCDDTNVRVGVIDNLTLGDASKYWTFSWTNGVYVERPILYWFAK